MEIPPIVKISENTLFDDPTNEDFRLIDAEMRGDKAGDFDDFTDQQKEYISNVLDQKLAKQREKLTNYFQNMQIEMIRQFQIQYLELSQVIDDVVESKNRSKFVNNL